PEILRLFGKFLLNAAGAVSRRVDHRRRIGWHDWLGRIGLLGVGGPGLMEVLRRLGLAGRLDFQAAIARQTAGAWIIVTDRRRRFDRMAAIHRGLNVDALAEPPIALDDGIGRIDAVDDHWHAGTPGNDDNGT